MCKASNQERGAESWPSVLFYSQNLSIMKVSLRKLETELEVRAALLARASKVTISDIFITVEVAEWREFLSIYWKACSDVTRGANWRLAMRKRRVVVILDNGRRFSSWVHMHMDNQGKWGLWYASAVEE